MLMLHGRLASVPGRRDELLGILLEGQDSEPMPGCRLYLVAVDVDDPDGVWVTEVWDSEDAHTASLELEHVRERITRAMPLIDRSGMRQQRLDPRGGVPDANALSPRGASLADHAASRDTLPATGTGEPRDTR